MKFSKVRWFSSFALSYLTVLLLAVNGYAETGDTLVLPDTGSTGTIVTEPTDTTIPSDSSISIDKGSVVSSDAGVAAATTSGSESTSEGAPPLMGGTGGSSGSDTALPDLFTGTMSYRIPIEVPKGRNGMDPGLSLLYRSGSGNGWVGVGWEFEVGAIERSTKNGVKYDGTDIYLFRMAGATIELVSVGGNEYRAKIEGAFNRFQFVSSSYWIVTDKKGTQYRFGYDTSSRQDSGSQIFKWCLDRVTDTNGNYMEITYYKNQGQIYPSQINYTGNDNTGAGTTNYVKFNRESRTDAPDMYTTNFGVKTAYRLKTIEVYANASRQRTYSLSYKPYSANTGRSLLTSITQYGNDGTSSLPAITLNY
ncbi:MAG: SpvB/TcaC N-terminal domain-containing protein [Deltaproteobacteria bacterium]|nr:SpvB/TcaC N-terminal domain-containing protein [Deltaproteobacteria bacterium]